MNVFIRAGALIIINYLILSKNHFVWGVKPKCMSTKPASDETFKEHHYGDIGFVRDIAVEVARNLNLKLELPKETSLCKQLANIKTSNWLRRKWQRTDLKKENVLNNIKTKAIDMMQEFNENVSKNYAIQNVQDQKIVADIIDWGIEKLTTEAKAFEENSEFIGEMKQLKLSFCEKYLTGIWIQKFNNNNEFKDKIQRRDKPVIVEFHSPSCKPCITMAPLMEKVVKSKKGEVYLVTVDADSFPDIAEHCGVTTVLPFVALFRKGAKIDQFTNARDENGILNFLKVNNI